MRIRRALGAFAVAAVAAVCALAAVPNLAAGPSPLPDTVPGYLYGAGLVRARVIALGGSVLHEYNLDRGQVRALSAGAITLKERDGLSDPIPVSTTARIQVNGRLAGFGALRKGMSAVVVRDGDDPAEAVVAARRVLPTGWLSATYFGPNMVRLEAYVQRNGIPHDYRLDRGRIRGVGAGALVLRERDGQVFTIPVSPTAKIKLNDHASSFGTLRRGMYAATLRDNDAPASLVQAFTR